MFNRLADKNLLMAFFIGALSLPSLFVVYLWMATTNKTTISTKHSSSNYVLLRIEAYEKRRNGEYRGVLFPKNNQWKYLMRLSEFDNGDKAHFGLGITFETYSKLVEDCPPDTEIILHRNEMETSPTPWSTTCPDVPRTARTYFESICDG